MLIPVLKILIVEDHVKQRKQIVENLAACTAFFDREDIKIELLEAHSLEQALLYLQEDGDIQSVMLSLDIRRGKPSKQLMPVAKIIDAIKAIRVSIPLYILSDETDGLNIINASSKIESFFYREDIVLDPESIMNYIINDFDDRSQTPFWTEYKKYVTESNDSWHTPGHSGGASFRNSPHIHDFYHFFGRNAFVSDLSISVDSLGSLTEGTKAIGKSQEAAAYTFEVAKTFYVTNGSSTSNKIILQTLLRKGDQVIADRNCHKSVHYGIVQAGANPLYLDSTFQPDYGIFAPPKLADIQAKITENPDARLLVLTGCTYDGLLLDIQQIVEFAHAHDVKVFIDEAWFAYSLFHPQFRPYSAINAGADYVTHSAHKVISAFSQASYIHVNDPDFDADFFHEIYSIYASTSPKYQIIASLDVCHKQLEMEGYGMIHKLLQYVKELKTEVNKLQKIRIVGPEDFARVFPHYETDNISHDPLKILIDVSRLNYSTQDIHRYLRNEIGLEIEKYTHSTLLVLLTLGGTRSKVVRLYNALKKLDEDNVTLLPGKLRRKIPANLPPIELSCLPADAFFGPRESLALEQSKGRIAAGLVTPYPPGIPLLIPGQLIQQVHIDYLKALDAQKLTIQGSYDGEIYVLKENAS